MLDKNNIPKDLFGTEYEVTTRLSEELKCTRSEARAALDYFVQIGLITKDRSSSYYSYNKNFDWDDYENSQYTKYRYLVSGSIGDRKFNGIVEWNKRDLGGLYDEIKKGFELSPNEVGLISISNMIEIGYPHEVDS